MDTDMAVPSHILVRTYDTYSIRIEHDSADKLLFVAFPNYVLVDQLSNYCYNDTLLLVI